ncbi:MAG: hypothetical protein ABL925_15720 [Methylococcales bacterium]
MSKTIVKILIKLTSLTVSALLIACSSATIKQTEPGKIIDLSSANLPGVAAEFLTTREGQENEDDQHDAQAHKVTWRFWRDSRQMTIERPQLSMGELWQRDGQSIIHRKLYHGDHRAIEFQDDDLRMLAASPSWQKLALLVDQKLLAQLSVSDIEWSDGYPAREYQGKIAETQWHIVMRMDLGLPVLIERRQPGFSERTELLNAYALSAAPWQPTPTTGYDVIDFADLGDKEYDPFVIKVQAQMGHEHHH